VSFRVSQTYILFQKKNDFWKKKCPAATKV
jgi:hypothetical protein